MDLNELETDRMAVNVRRPTKQNWRWLLRLVAVGLVVTWVGCGETDGDATNGDNDASQNEVANQGESNAASNQGENDQNSNNEENNQGPNNEENNQESNSANGGVAGIFFVEQPGPELTAGQDFEVAVQVADTDDEPVDVGDIEVVLSLSDHAFASGENVITEVTGDGGLVEFDGLSVERAGSAYTLTAEIDVEQGGDAQVESQPFDVVHGDPATEESWITGESGVAADGATEAEITVELADTFGNAVPGEQPQFEATGEGNGYGSCTETDSDGIANCTMTSTVAEEKELVLTEPVTIDGDTIEFLLDCNPNLYPFGGGSGTAEDPRRICSPEQLNAIGDADGHLADAFILTDDIDMSSVSNFTIIGDYDDSGSSPTGSFGGDFDGNGRTISNLTVDNTNANATGMFGRISGSVKDLVLEDVEVYGSSRTGGLAGLNVGTITDVHVSGVVEGTREVGGLIGRVWSGGKIYDSSSAADVRGGEEYRNIGGLIGEVGATSTGAEAEVKRSYATGTVEGGSTRVGGLIGTINRRATVEDCFATGDVSSGWNVGGVAGWLRGHLRRAYATGKVEPEDDYERAGGVVGSYFDNREPEHSYWDIQTSQIGTSSGTSYTDYGQPLNTAEFGDEDKFEDWDFDTVWEIGTAPDGETRPVLQ